MNRGRMFIKKSFFKKIQKKKIGPGKQWEKGNRMETQKGERKKSYSGELLSGSEIWRTWWGKEGERGNGVAI